MSGLQEIISSLNKIPPGIKTGWLHVALPMIRECPEYHTYDFFSYEDLPPIKRQLDDNFEWLKQEPAFTDGADGLLAKGCYGDGSKPDLGKLQNIIRHASVKLPDSFTLFLQSQELHRRIRSCTDCYLDVADRSIPTTGRIKGQLVHFLSDSQWCLHWYLHVDQTGNQFVIVSHDAYGFDYVDADEEIFPSLAKIAIDLELEEQVWFCAPSFNDFIYRFWLENEIWFKLIWEKQPMDSLNWECQEYIQHYLQQQVTSNDATE